MEKGPQLEQLNKEESYTSGEITGRGGRMNFLGEKGVAEFLQKYGDTVPIDVCHNSKYGDMDYQKRWLVKVETSEGIFDIPKDLDFKDSFGGDKKCKGVSINEFIKSKGIKTEDIKKITLDITR